MKTKTDKLDKILANLRGATLRGPTIKKQPSYPHQGKDEARMIAEKFEPPSFVEAGLCFSSVGFFMIKLRSELSDVMIDLIVTYCASA